VGFGGRGHARILFSAFFLMFAMLWHFLILFFAVGWSVFDCCFSQLDSWWKFPLKYT
jgi:hypothetical protein